MTRDNDPRFTGAAVPLKLTQPDGEEIELQCTALSDKDMDEVDAWLRSEFVSRVEHACAGSNSEMTKQAMITQAVATVSAVHFMDAGIGSRMIASPKGLTRLMYQAIKKNHPKMTFERLRALLSDEANRKKSRTFWEDLNLGKEKTKKTGEDDADRE